jgi:hypothetical protein
MAWRAMGWASMKSLSGPAHGLEPTAQQLRPLEELEKLKKVLEPKQGLRAVRQVLKWPLTEKDVNKTLQCLQRLNVLFELALAGDHT